MMDPREVARSIEEKCENAAERQRRYAERKKNDASLTLLTLR